MAAKRNVLFLCTSNSARSQMAEAFLKKYAGDEFNVYSAGLEPGEIDPMTRQVMREAGLKMGGQYAKSVRTYLGRLMVHHLIIVCEEADRRCPHTWPGLEMQRRMLWSFEDPVAFPGGPDARIEKFRQVRDQVEQRIKSWLEDMRRHDESEMPQETAGRKG